MMAHLINVSSQNEKNFTLQKMENFLDFLDVFENEPLPNKSEIWNEKEFK